MIIGDFDRRLLKAAAGRRDGGKVPARILQDGLQ